MFMKEKTHVTSNARGQGRCYLLASYRSQPRWKLTACVAALAASAPAAHAFELMNQDGFKIVWDTNIKYSNAWRLKDPSATLTAEVNQDDGDRNFEKGMISNRLDVLSEMDLTYGNFGARVSGAGWYDTIYNNDTDNDSPATVNSFSVAPDRFTKAVRDLHGRKAELLDAFVFAKFNLGEMRSVVRLGKHTIVFGETLFFGANGIAGAQAPVDAIKALSVPNTQFKELLMPVNQFSGQLQINSNWTVTGYYQFEWKKTRIPGAGSYFSTVDVLDAGGERFIVGPPMIPGGPAAALFRADNINAKDSGQGGLSLRWRPNDSNVEYGFYAVNYHDKTPQTYAIPGAGVNPATGQAGLYQLAYPENIETYGASFSTVVAGVNVAGEASMRFHAPLVSDGQTLPFEGAADNDNNPAYAVGRTQHLNLSAIAVLGSSPLYKSATVTAEAGWNRLDKITKNPAALDPNTTRQAWGLRFIFEPAYYQVISGLDMTIPIGLGYTDGKSASVGSFGVDNGGDLSVGLKGTYKNNLRLSLNYIAYLGDAKTTLNPTAIGYEFNFGQAQKDRDFLSFSAQYSF
jgi:hypothetical protein